MVTAIVSIGGTALEVCYAACKERSAAKAGRPLDADKLISRGFRKFCRQRLLRGAKHVDCEMARVLKVLNP